MCNCPGAVRIISSSQRPPNSYLQAVCVVGKLSEPFNSVQSHKRPRAARTVPADRGPCHHSGCNIDTHTYSSSNIANKALRNTLVACRTIPYTKNRSSVTCTTGELGLVSKLKPSTPPTKVRPKNPFPAYMQSLLDAARVQLGLRLYLL